MLQTGSWLLDRARTYGQRFFLQFGLHCATHQIRIILVSGIVIMSLFYPALALYSSSQTKSIYDIFTSPYSGIYAPNDLVNLWSGHPSLQTQEDPLSRGKCVRGVRIVRVERVLIQSLLKEDDGALNNRILLSTLDLETSLQKTLSSLKSPCITKPDGQCFVLSPLAFWNHDGHALLSDRNILDTLSLSKSVSIAGIPVTPQMVLAGRDSNEHHVAGDSFDFAKFLALTYFFSESDCTDTTGHNAWLDALKAVAANKAELKVHAQDPTLIALDYTLQAKKGWSAISAFLYLSYASFFVYVFWSMRQINSVHSRVGVAFTAAIEIVVSTITSLSVCALVGFKVTMVPWELLPIMIVFVGAENMFNLVDAVGRTSVTLTVKQRIAEGLSRAGTSNTLKVVSYNAILGIIAVFAADAIRQFCIFAVVVLVAHWFLAHTFFMAVLSIDIQRLELEELLRQDSGLAPSLTTVHPEKNTPTKSTSVWRKLGFLVRKVLSGRAKKNLSLFLMLAITATLYYATLPPDINIDNTVTTQTPRWALSRNTTNNNLDPAWQIWKVLNPHGSVFYLRVEEPSTLTFRPDINGFDPTVVDYRSHRTRWSHTVRTVFWLLKIMVLPIAATTFVLWILTLYLLKDADLLDAQKHRAGSEPPEPKDDPTALESQVSFSTLPRAFSSDVELIATSADGRVVISVGLHNEVIIWQLESQKYFSIDTSEILLRAASTSLATSTLTSVAMDDKGEYCAVGTGTGVIAVWDIRKRKIRPLPHLSLSDSAAGVVQLEFVPTVPAKPIVTTPPMSEPASPVLAPTPTPETVFIVATYENGMAVKYAIRDLPALAYFYPSRRVPIIHSKLVRVTPEDQLLVAFCLEDGSVELMDTGEVNGVIKGDSVIIQAGNPADTVSKVHVCHVFLGGEMRIIVVAATDAGIVSLWDGQSGECIRILEEQYGRINQIRVAPVQTETCHYCGHLPQDSFSLSFSVDHVVRFFKYYLTDDDRRCSCTSTALRRVTSRENMLSGRRSRSSSISSSVGSSSPLMMSRNRRVPASDVSPFPVSGHGVHSRRASEKDASRRLSEVLAFPVEFEEGELGRTVGPQETARVSSSLWQNSVFVRVGDTTCERGGWDVVHDGKVVGVRRKPRSLVVEKSSSSLSSFKKLTSSKGLSSTILERWEIWTFDPCITNIQSSALSSIVAESRVDEAAELESRSSSTTSSSQSSFSNSDSESLSGNEQCIPRLPFTRVTPFKVTHSRSLAGFGNTLGVFDFLKL